MLRIRFAYSKLRLGNVTAGSYFGGSAFTNVWKRKKNCYIHQASSIERSKFIGLNREKKKVLPKFHQKVVKIVSFFRLLR
jgi:hypothetical protein